MEKDWRKSEKADELREFINKEMKPKKSTIGGLERELIIDFAAKEIAQAKSEGYREILKLLEENDWKLQEGDTNPYKKIETRVHNQALDVIYAKVTARIDQLSSRRSEEKI